MKKPIMYKKSIYDIDYSKLKKLGIKTLIFDLDNTLALLDDNFDYSKAKELIDELKKDFKVFIVSNSKKKRVSKYSDIFGIECVYFAMKPLTKGLNKLTKKYSLKKSEICMIGDQLVTDIFSGILFGINTILVDPLGKKDLKITGFNRTIEKLIFGLSKNFKRGKYYE